MPIRRCAPLTAPLTAVVVALLTALLVTAPADAAVRAPSAPRGVSVAPGDASATVRWSPPRSTGGAPITGYVVKRAATSTGPWTTAATPGAAARSVVIRRLTNGHASWIRVFAKNRAGLGAAAPTLKVTPRAPATAPAAPVVTAALGATAGTVRVAWTAPADGGSPLTGYTIAESTDGSSFTTAATTGAATTSHTFSGLTYGTTYRFRVRAQNAVGAGAWSAPAAATPVTVPSITRNLAATAGDGQIALTWTAPASDGGAPIHYVVGEWDGSSYAPVGTTGTTAYTVTGLTNGTTYSFSVWAVNSVGAGPGAASVFATPVSTATIPGIPTGLTGTPGDGVAMLAWTAPTSTGGAPIHYVVAQWNGTKYAPIATTNATSYTVTGLTNGTTYSFAVWAENSVGPSPGAPHVAVTPSAGTTIPGVPTGLTGTPGDGQAALSWTAPSYTGGAPIHYVVAQWNGTKYAEIATTDATSYTVTGLTDGTTYSFTVWAENSVGPSPGAAAPVSVTPTTTAPAPTIPGIPTGLTGTPGDGQATLSWTAPGSTGGAPIHYVVGQWNAGTKKFDQIATTDATGYTVTGLTNGTTYSFTVWAVNTVGPSAGAAAPVAVTPTDGATIPGIPTGLTGTAGDHQATLSWTAPSYTGGAPVHYVVAQWNPTTKAFDQIATTDATSYTVTGLTNGTSYTFTVWAVNKVGPSPGAAAAVTVRPTGPDEPTIPGIPTGMTATPGDRHATLAWTAPAYTGNAPLHYVVAQWNTTTQQFDQIATTDATTYDVTGLVNGRIYTFTVWAVNSVGPSPGAAGPVSVIPEGTVPPL